MNKFIYSSLVVVALTGCTSMHQQDGPVTLKQAYKKDFLIGVAVNESQFTERDARGAEMIKAQFSSISPENVLKWESVHSKAGTFDFSMADKYVDFGERNHMAIIGHTLVWHSQTPAWVFQGENGKPLDRDGLLKRMQEHISTVVGRYKGRIHGWDVVNEALNDDGTLRQSPWRRIIGDDYIEKAFQFAHAADPKAELYYNDYSIDNEAKRKGAVALVKRLKSKGILITGVGSQSHNKMDWPKPEQVEATLMAFKEVGAKVMITELDIDVLPGRNQSADVSTRVQGVAGNNPYTNGLPDSVQQALAQRYADFFAVLVKHRDTVGRVTFWGLNDGDSWLNNFPTRGRTNHPLLFDRKGQPKPAFDAVIKAAKPVKTR